MQMNAPTSTTNFSRSIVPVGIQCVNSHSVKCCKCSATESHYLVLQSLALAFHQELVHVILYKEFLTSHWREYSYIEVTVHLHDYHNNQLVLVEVNVLIKLVSKTLCCVLVHKLLMLACACTLLHISQSFSISHICSQEQIWLRALTLNYGQDHSELHPQHHHIQQHHCSTVYVQAAYT